MEWQDRIEKKIDNLDEKLDLHLERITRAETSIQYLKWGISILITLSGSAALAFIKYSGQS